MSTINSNNISPDHPLIDVRRADEFTAGHLPGACNIPLEQIVQDPRSVSIPEGAQLYCRSGHRSGQARQILRRMGIETTNLGGIEGYTGKIEL